MRNKNLLPLLALFLLLGAASTWYWLQEKKSSSSPLAEERRFAVEASRIGKIALVRRDGETIRLERKGSDWQYNGRWKARPTAIANLLDAVTRITIAYKPAQAAVPNMVKNLATEGIKVELYSPSGTLLMVYYVGGSTPDERGTFVIREGYDQPYVAELPGWEGNLRFRYNLRGEDWRDRSVFAEDPDAIQWVSIEYPRQRNQSFRLEKKQGGFEVTPFYPHVPKSPLPLRLGAAEAFLVGFEQLGAEAFENDYPYQDSIRQMLPFAEIALGYAQGGGKKVRFYPIENPADPSGMPANGETERFFAATDEGDFMLVQNRVFRKVFWGYSFFFR